VCNAKQSTNKLLSNSNIKSHCQKVHPELFAAIAKIEDRCCNTTAIWRSPAC
jgi:hypothetical protein